MMPAAGAAPVPPVGDDWPSVNAWRRTVRRDLVARRMSVDPDTRARVTRAVVRRLDGEVPVTPGICIGFYWPFRGELDLRPLIGDFLTRGAGAALPVVVEKKAPVEFWSWAPKARMKRGEWNIPVPAERAPVTPDVLLIPLVGFDGGCYRLGNGGGYYDRTLAAMETTPLKIGVGFAFGRLDTIHPQAFDVPLDRIVTEAGVERRRT